MKTYAVVGLGYVGLGLAIALAKKNHVYGYDISENRIQALKKHEDKNHQLDHKALRASTVMFTHRLEDIRSANFYFIVVSTPAYHYEIPNLEPLIAAVKQIATILKKGDIIVFESTVYPGTTEEICIPLLEEISHLKCGKDFNVGYSPERINPGDKIHTLKNVTKVISAQNKKTLKAVEEAYLSICDKVYPVSNIPTAEAVKILENTQRDVNIALLNEFSKIMHAMNLNVQEVLKGTHTKWNALHFTPGFVGGHCISIDPHYLAFKAKRVGIQPDLILTARKINDSMTHFVIESLFEIFMHHKINTENIKIGILGISYKENTNDIRNSLALKLIKELKALDIQCLVHDPFEHPDLVPFEELSDLTAIILLVGHDAYKKMGLKKILKICKKPSILMDIPNLFIKEVKKIKELIYWSM